MTALKLAPMPVDHYAAWHTQMMERRLRWQFLPLFDDHQAAEAQLQQLAQLAPHCSTSQVHQILDADQVRGWVWFHEGADSPADFVVLDAEFEGAASDLLETLVARAGSAKRLVLQVLAQASTTSALAALPGMEVSAANLALRLPTHQSPARVSLTEMGAQQFALWVEQVILGYAEELQNSMGTAPQAALQEAKRSTDALLPEGLQTPDQHIFEVRDGGVQVATLWIARRSPTAYFVYDIEVIAQARGRGLGRATMQAAAQWCTERGARVLALNVFGQNTVARRLYDSLGYELVLEGRNLTLPGDPDDPAMATAGGQG